MSKKLSPEEFKHLLVSKDKREVDRYSTAMKRESKAYHEARRETSNPRVLQLIDSCYISLFLSNLQLQPVTCITNNMAALVYLLRKVRDYQINSEDSIKLKEFFQIMDRIFDIYLRNNVLYTYLSHSHDSKTIIILMQRADRGVCNVEVMATLNAETKDNPDEVEKVEEEIYQTSLDRILNILLCRGDLAKEKLEARPVGYSELLRYGSTKDKVYILLGVILAILCGILQPVTCVLSGFVADVFLKATNLTGNDEFYNDSLLFVIGFIIVGVALFCICFLQQYFLYNGCVSIANNVRKEFIGAVLRQDAAWMDNRDAGGITSLLNNNIERFQDGIGDKIGLILRGVFNFLSSIIICFCFDWKTTLVTIWVGPVGAITMAIMARVAARSTTKMLDRACEADALAEESIMNVKTIAACNGQKTMIQKFKNILDDGQRSAVIMYFWNGFFEGFMFFQLYLFYAIGLVKSVTSYYNSGEDNPGNVLIVVNTMLMGAYFLGLLGPHLMCLLKARVAAAVIYKTIERPILNGLSWEAKSGETVALVGHSGCGKSTSIGLITRLYDALGGQILIDGVDITCFKPNDLRKIIGIVQQEPCLFNGTIRENIRLGREEISDFMMEELCKTANAHDFIMKLENGYDTLLGIGGVSLSGGQKQRIAIARAIAGNPKILLLDEATSALDTESEKVVQIALKNASKGRTTIVIAHRLSTLRDANRIYVIDKGIVVEIGTHYELIANGGLYSTLAKAQEIEQSQPIRFERDSESKINIKKQRSNSSFGFNLRASVNGRASSNSIRSHVPVGGEQELEISEKTGKKRQASSGGLWSYYRSSLSVAPLLTFLSFFFTVMRGLELPLQSINLLLSYDVLNHDADDYAKSLITAGCYATGLGLWCWLFLCTASLFSGWAAERVTNRLRVDVLSNLLSQDAAFFDKPGMSNAACVASLSLNAPNAAAALDPRMVLITNNAVAVVGCVVVSVVACWPIGVAGIALITLMIGMQIILSWRIQRLYTIKEVEDTTAELAIEIFEQARTIQLLTVENYFLERYTALQKKIQSIDHLISIYQSIIFALLISYLYFSDFVSFIVGINLIYKGSASPTTVFAGVLGTNTAGWAVIFLAPSMMDIVKASNACRSLFRLSKAPSVYGEEEAGETPDVQGNVAVEKVHFSYPARPNVRVARNLNITAKRGEAIALVGASGCGKSTVIGLLERFYTAQAGMLKVDESDILGINLRHLRRNIALVGQEPVLFRGSIFENVSLGVEDSTLEDVIAACQTANAAKFIESFPLGYHTDVGEKGRNLSGGQKQRIAIARALVRNPKIILLDEATSALDTESEKMVQEALNEASSGRTSITIAHRLSTIQNANMIYYIENGGVVEYGTHQELLEHDGKYAALVKAQMLSTEEE